MLHPSYTILMADIISSGYFEQEHLMNDFKKVITVINKRHKKHLLSPLTITLGDEFQGIPDSLQSALNIIFDLEEMLIQQHFTFRLRYALGEGVIDTPINEKIAYGMLGSGLTQVRQALETLKQEHHRFHVATYNPKTNEALHQAFIVYQSLVDAWRPDKDYTTVAGFLEEKDYKAVARRIGQNYSQTWKKQRSLHIDEYRAIKGLITYIGEMV
jgi:hypothetical protein